MTPSSKICSSGRSSRKREAGQTVAEYAVVLSVITISVAVVFVILSGGTSVAIERVVDLIPV
jgi:Flp pilus assembly pilin Flp